MVFTPRTDVDGPTLTFDFPGVEVGVAEYEEGPTGCTVLRFPAGALTAIDERGGLVGSIGQWEWNHAICLAGGSLLGLEAAGGVHSALHEGLAGPVRLTGAPPFKFVSGAIVFDFGVRENAVYPDFALGRAAAKAALPGRFPLGPRGAGRSATVGKFLFAGAGREPGGQGAAFREFGGARILACTVVNALGAVVDRDGVVVRGHRDPSTGKRRRALEVVEGDAVGGVAGENTTLTVVVTDARLDGRALRQFGRQVHTSMARAIEPFHTASDGDVLYAVTTASAEASVSADTLAVVAAEVVWDAVLAAVR